MNLTVSGLTKTFTKADENIELFHDFSLSLNAGEALTVLGPSGSGKTTLLRMIAGLEQPDSGTIQFDGQDLFGMSPEERRAFRLHHIGFADQYARLLPQLTALENAQIPAASFSGSPWRARWSSNRNFCCWTSRHPRWTPPGATPCWNSCAT